MSEHHPISDLMTETMSKIKEMVDVNTIIGNPIVAADGTTVIPVSKVSFGFGAGGSEFASKHAASGSPLAFGGGSGAGVTVSPVCFLVIGKDGSANVVMCSAMGQESMVMDAVRSGAKDFIVKPFKPDRVLKTVTAILGG